MRRLLLIYISCIVLNVTNGVENNATATTESTTNATDALTTVKGEALAAPEPHRVCPEKCVCVTMTSSKHPDKDSQTDYDITNRSVIINCRQIGIDKFPSALDMSNETLELDLSFNKITSLTTTDSVDSLRKLDLEANGLSYADKEAFDRMTNLVDLNMAYNEINELHQEIFSKLTNLRILKLSNNHLQSLHQDIFKSNIHLLEVYLNGNPLIHVFPSWFEQSKKLQILNLANTQMLALPVDIFRYTRDLKSLDLSDNNFTSIPTISLRGAVHLKTLIIDNNQIGKLDETSFEKMTSLENLQICRNHDLVEVLAGTFADQYNLKKLAIAQNPHLFYIDRMAFYGMFNASWFKLQEVSLRDNRITTLDRVSMPWDQLKRLDVQRNPLNCDCKLDWLTTTKSVVGGARCAEPEQFRGLEIHRIAVRDFKCVDMYHSRAGFRFFVIMFGSIILFCVGIAIVMVLKRHEIVRWWSNKKQGTGSIYYVKANSFSNEMHDDMNDFK